MRAQALILTTLILTAAALLISLALWNYFSSIANIQGEAALIASIIARESTRIIITKLSSVSVTTDSNYSRIAYQITTLDYQPALTYLLLLNEYPSNPTPLNITIYSMSDTYANITNTSTLALLNDYELTKSKNVLIKPLNSNDYAELSIYWKGILKLHKLYLNGTPRVIIIEVKKSLIRNAWLLILIKINNKYYQVNAQAVS